MAEKTTLSFLQAVVDGVPEHQKSDLLPFVKRVCDKVLEDRLRKRIDIFVPIDDREKLLEELRAKAREYAYYKTYLYDGFMRFMREQGHFGVQVR